MGMVISKKVVIKMRIYKLSITNNYAYLVEENAELINKHRCYFRSSFKTDEKIFLKIADNDDSPVGDYAEVYIPVFSKKSFDCLLPLISSEVHYIEWSLGQTPMYGIQVPSINNCIDWSHSVFNSITPHLIVFKQYAFVETELKDKNIFKIENNPFVYVSQRFVDIVKKNNLTNFGFELVYDGNE